MPFFEWLVISDKWIALVERIKASGQRESNGVYGLWQIKKHTLAVSSWFCGCQRVIMNGELWMENYELGCFGNVARTKTMKILPMSAVSL